VVKITPKLYFYKSIIQLHVSWVKTYKDIHVELHRRRVYSLDRL